jgi:hypothetical protein
LFYLGDLGKGNELFSLAAYEKNMYGIHAVYVRW